MKDQTTDQYLTSLRMSLLSQTERKRRALIYREGRNSKSCQTPRLTSLPIGAEKTINEKMYAGIYFATQFSKTALFCDHATFPF